MIWDFLSLHSTMFLLILTTLQVIEDIFQSLHSTMFLLIHRENGAERISFTFHDVSINTFHIPLKTSGYTPLHSTMFLLIRGLYSTISSVNLPLHSTMFLLILVSCFSSCALSRTLHSTMFLLIPPPRTDIVNTLSPLHSTMFLLIPLLKCQAFRSVFLYIPRCFY